MKRIHIIFLLTTLFPYMSQAQEIIEEAKLTFKLPQKWKLEQKAGTFDAGIVQYFYRREPVPTPEGTEAYPAAIFILDKVKGGTLEDYVTDDVRSEKNGRLSSGEFDPIENVNIDGLEGRLVKISMEDSGYRLRTSIYYFSNNDVVVKLVLNTIRDPNPAISELEAIINSVKRQ